MERKDPGKTYLVTNLKNKKQYVGFTRHSVEYRFNCHIRGVYASSLLHADVLKFGKENFIVETVFEGTCEQALENEKYFIRKLKTQWPDGYNKTKGGEAVFGYIPTIDFRVNVSRRHKGKILSVETRAKISAANKGRKFSKRHLINLSIAHKGQGLGRKIKPSIKKKLSLAAIRVASDPAERRRRSERAKQQHADGVLGSHTFSKEGIARRSAAVSAAKKGRKLNSSTIRKMRKGIKRARANPELREAARLRNLGRHLSEETKKKISMSNMGRKTSLLARRRSSAHMKAYNKTRYSRPKQK